MILPAHYVAIELETEAGSRRYHDALIYLATPEGRQGRPWVGVLRDIARTHTEVPNDDRGAWARLFLLRTEGEGEDPAAPAPGIGLATRRGRSDSWPTPEDLRDQLVGVPYTRFPSPTWARGSRQIRNPVQAPWSRSRDRARIRSSAGIAGRTRAEPEPEPEPAPAPATGGQPEPVAAEYPIYQGVTLAVTRERAGWLLTFRHEGRALLTVVEARPPWAGGVQTQRRIVSALGDVLVGEGMPDRDHVAARRLATFAQLIEEWVRGDNLAGRVRHRGSDDAPDAGVVEERHRFLGNGDPVNTCSGCTRSITRVPGGCAGPGVDNRMPKCCQRIWNSCSIVWRARIWEKSCSRDLAGYAPGAVSPLRVVLRPKFILRQPDCGAAGLRRRPGPQPHDAGDDQGGYDTLPGTDQTPNRHHRAQIGGSHTTAENRLYFLPG